MKKVSIGILIFVMLIFMFGCEKQKSYEDLMKEFQDHLNDRHELYEERLGFFNTASTETIKTLVMVNVTITPTNRSVRASGVIYKETQTHYYVLTNHHVVHVQDNENAAYRVQDYQGNLYQATLIASDPAYDLAILSFSKSFIALDVIALSNENALKNDSIIIMGYPNMRMVSITMGNVINYSLINISHINETVIDIQFEVITTYTPVNYGSSGSLVINERFELIGIVYSAYIPSHSEVSRATFIIPILKVLEYIELVQGGDFS